MTARRPVRISGVLGTVPVLLALGLLPACSADRPAAPVTAPAPAPTATAGMSTAGPVATAVPSEPSEPAEPTTTNTLPPPPDPTRPAPSTAGGLDAAVLPVPAGWRTVARPGSREEGYLGNGTWVHARDPRYAALGAITIGCADVSRDDYPDPVRALEGNYEDADGAPGIGLVLQFRDAGAASRYWDRYADQVRACSTLDDPVHTELVPVGQPPDGEALMDRRTYPDGEWTEVGVRRGDRVTLLILSDDGHDLNRAQAARIVASAR